MNDTRSAGWQRLVQGFPWFDARRRYPIAAYSEFMPAPRLGRSLYGDIDRSLFAADDPFGWRVAEVEEEYELRPGLEQIAAQVIHHLKRFGQGQPDPYLEGHDRRSLEGNPYWSPELDAHRGGLPRECYVTLLPLALAKTQDDHGRVRWTLFGNSDQGPERAFWESFFTSPDEEIPAADSIRIVARLLEHVYGETARSAQDLLNLGFRILPSAVDPDFPYWSMPRLPAWTSPFLLQDEASVEDVCYLLTFQPFPRLPSALRSRYLAGRLALLPSPFSLLFWGMPVYRQARRQYPLAMQYPILPLVARHEGPGLRVPQSAWLHEARRDGAAEEIAEDLLLNTYTRTHRWDRVHRDQDGLEHSRHVASVTETLFSTALDDLGLYGKPMARNCQIWTRQGALVLDGPRAKPEDLHRAAETVLQGGLFRYFFVFPAMQVGRYEVYWHRPLAAHVSQGDGQVRTVEAALDGFLTGYDAAQPDPAQPVVLYPRRLARPEILSALRHLDESHDHYRHQTPLNVLTILDMAERWDEPRLPRRFARQMLRQAKDEKVRDWLSAVAQRATQPSAERRLTAALAGRIEPDERPLPEPITYGQTASRAYEEAYWNDLALLADGKFVTKDNADVVDDEPTRRRTPHRQRDLHALGEALLARHRQAIRAAGMEGRAFAGEVPFSWETDFDYTAFGGWAHDRAGKEYERNLLVVIPGRDRRQAVVLGDHYDTAYMEDVFETDLGGDGARLAAAGADDNASATATLLQAAPVFLQLAQQGRLERDVWLLHLTGEEFPSDCLGARSFCQALVERSLSLTLEGGSTIDLSGTQVVGVLVMDMIAHNRDSAHNVFQISPGRSQASLRLAYQAHLANEIWNEAADAWNGNPERRDRGPGVRSSDGRSLPPIARFPRLDGEVRTFDNPLSSVFNTDVQIFADIGAPCLLVMEDYDINRSGYHDTQDTLANIDLDYGAALSAICIETIARVATGAMGL
ncbi:MAG TPA: M28 family peptidase [Anaerolineales bacterium]|nr:M28 family peptidase [Anaerolineales bacterium]